MVADVVPSKGVGTLSTIESAGRMQSINRALAHDAYW
jgi:hypothetical protein